MHLSYSLINYELNNKLLPKSSYNLSDPATIQNIIWLTHRKLKKRVIERKQILDICIVTK